MFHQRLGRRRLCHVAVATRAIYSNSNVRRMLKLHKRTGGEPVYPCPRNFTRGGSVRRDLLDLRIVLSDHRVAQHALRDRWNRGLRAHVGITVAIQALQSSIDVYFVGIGNGLRGSEERAGREHQATGTAPTSKFS
jgi:hypothetical protein